MEPSWFEQKKHEWLYKGEMARRHREVKKYAKQQAKEQKQFDREISGSPTLSQRYERWAQERAVKKELKAEQWRQLQEQHPTLGWLKKHESKFFWLFALCMLTVFAGYIAVEARRSDALAKDRIKASRTMANINGKPIYLEAVLDRAFLAHGATILQELSEQELVRQEAERQKIQLTSEELRKIDVIVGSGPQKRVQRPRLETSFLTRRLILKNVTDERKKEVYRDFKQDVVNYGITVLTFADKASALAFISELKDGKDFSAVAAAHTIDSQDPKSLGSFTLARLEKFFGKYATKTVQDLAIGQMTSPLSRDGKYFVIRLDSVLRDYVDVQEAIDTLIVEAEAPQYMYDLVAKAKVESPYIDPEISDFKDDTPLPSETSTPSPSLSPSPR